MTAQDFIHPEDAAALNVLESIPALPSIMKKVMNIGAERQYYGLNMASKVKLSPTQLPELYNLLPPICRRLDIKEPDFYLEMNPSPNAFAFGDTYTAITITSGIVELLTEEELTAVLAHECGHILCRHLLYHSLALALVYEIVRIDTFKTLVKPITRALLYWDRKSELSCDRVSAFISGPETAVRVQARLAGGPKSITEHLNIPEMVMQAEKYDEIVDEDLWNKALQFMAVMDRSHPFSAVRIREIITWVASDKYKELREQYPSCPHCYMEILPGATFCQYCGEKL